MKFTFCAIALSIGTSFALEPEGFKELKIGEKAPDFTLPATNGKTYSLGDFADQDVLLIYFTGTHCPTSNGVWPRLNKLIGEMKDESFGVVAINPNHNDGIRPDEYSYTTYDESFEDSKRYAEDLKWTFPFLYDGEKQQTPRAYGCLATPHVFIFDKERNLRYKGSFDDSKFKDPATVKKHYATDAVRAILGGTEVKTKVTRPVGCSTKWREKKAAVAKDEADWNAKPAVVNEITVDEVKKLRTNGTDKVRLINVWATWCGPCKEEMPHLSAINRKFSRRKFEVITIATDELKDKEAAETFLGAHNMVFGKKIEQSLKKEGRVTNNYLYNAANNDELAAALDPEWKGAVPYTILVNTKGEILYRHSGKIEYKEVETAVLKELTTYWQPIPEKPKKGKKRAAEK